MTVREDLETKLAGMSYEEAREACKDCKLLQGAKSKDEILSWYDTYGSSPEHERMVCEAFGILTKEQRQARAVTGAARDRKKELRLGLLVVFAATVTMITSVYGCVRGCHARPAPERDRGIHGILRACVSMLARARSPST